MAKLSVASALRRIVTAHWGCVRPSRCCCDTSCRPLSYHAGRA